MLWLSGFWERLYSALIKSPKLIFKPDFRMVFHLSRILNFKWFGVLPGRKTFSWKNCAKLRIQSKRILVIFSGSPWPWKLIHRSKTGLNYFPHTLKSKLPRLKMGVFLGCKSNWAKFTRRYDTRLFRVFTGHVWRKHVNFFFRAWKKKFKKKCHHVS